MSDKTWKVLRSTYALHTPWMSVRSDDCVTPKGVEIASYHTLEFPDFVHVLATSRDQIILVRQYRHGCGNLSLELPGGVVDEDDADVVAAGARELREETGYSGGDWSSVITLSVDPARYSNRVHFVRADGVAAGTAVPDPTEEIETVLVSRDEAMRLATSGAILNGVHAAMVLIGLSTRR